MLRALDPDPAWRYARAADLADALEAVAMRRPSPRGESIGTIARLGRQAGGGAGRCRRSIFEVGPAGPAGSGGLARLLDGQLPTNRASKDPRLRVDADDHPIEGVEQVLAVRVRSGV